MRPGQDPDIRPLYVGGITGATASDAAMKSDDDDDAKLDKTANPTYHESGSQDDDLGGSDEGAALGEFGTISDDATAIVKPERRMTFGTYFNAFPASYWRRWTDVESV